MSSLYERTKALSQIKVGGKSVTLTKEEIDKAWAASRQKQIDTLSRAEEERKRTASLPQPRFGGATISAPGGASSSRSPLRLTPDTPAGRIEAEVGKTRDFFRRELGGLGRFIFGASEDEMLGRSKREEGAGEGFFESIKQDVNSRGALRFLFQNSLKSKEEKALEGAATLARQGYTRSEANALATQYYQGGDNLPVNVRNALASNDAVTKAWSAVEVLDLVPAARSFTRGASMTVARDTLARSILAEDAVAARRIITEQFPRLEGTKELDDLVQLSRTLNDPKQSEQFFNEVMNATKRTPVETTTAAQRVFYENGVPVLRGAADTPTEGLVGLRDEIRAVLRGAKEGNRLSNFDIFQNEVDAGAIPFKATVGDDVEVFFRSGDAGGVGTRVSLSKDVAETLGEGSTKSFRAKPDDLVRLDDGTFVYAPKKQLSANLEPQLKQLRQAQRKRVEKVERARVKEVEAQRVARKAEAEAAARAKAQAKAERAAKVTNARRLLENGRKDADATITRIKADADERIAAIRARSSAKSELSKSITAATRELNRLIKTKASGTKINQAQRVLAKLTDQYIEPTKARTMMDEIRAERKRQLSEVRATYKAEQAAAKEVLKEADAETLEKVRKKEAKRAIEATTFTDTIANTFDDIANDVEATSVPERDIKKTRGSGKLVESQVVEGFMDEIRQARAAAGITDEKTATADMIKKLGFTHRVATNESQIRNAVERVGSDPAKAYNDFIRAGLDDETTVAALGRVLLKSRYVTDSEVRLNAVIRKMKDVASASGEQLQAFNSFNKADYGTIIGKLMRTSETMLEKRGINIKTEAAKIAEELGSQFDTLMTASKKGLLKEIDELICK